MQGGRRLEGELGNSAGRLEVATRLEEANVGGEVYGGGRQKVEDVRDGVARSNVERDGWIEIVMSEEGVVASQRPRENRLLLLPLMETKTWIESGGREWAEVDEEDLGRIMGVGRGPGGGAARSLGDKA